MQKTEICAIKGREILDSRGNPTVEAAVMLKGGAVGIARTPSGASTGKYEATELRDGDASRYDGKGVIKAVHHVNAEIAEALCGIDAEKQQEVDNIMCNLDGTNQKSRLGANAILAVSMAVCRAAAAQNGLPLWRYLGGAATKGLPVPMMNVLNGGAHAQNSLDVQEFMIVPIGAPTFAEAMRIGAEIYHHLGKILKKEGYSTGVGDEGGYAPDLQTPEQAMTLLIEAITASGHSTGEVCLALDVASSEWQCEGGYHLPKQDTHMSSSALVDTIAAWTSAFPILSVEDPLGEDDWQGWQSITEKIGQRTFLVGDDLFVTNTKRLETGIRKKAGNAILIKPNQIGTVSEMLDVISLAKKAGYRHILSHRSGETEDTAIADFAVATGAAFIKSGAPCRSERVCKYNRLLNITEEMGAAAVYGFHVK